MHEEDTSPMPIAHTIVHAQNINVWVLFSFVPTFIVARLIVHWFPWLFLVVRNVHIHHLTYGIILLSIVGFLLLNNKKQTHKPLLAVIYGIGLALSFDEFGMWLRLEDDYWVRQSYDALIIITALLISAIYIPGVIKSIGNIIKRRGHLEGEHIHDELS